MATLKEITDLIESPSKADLELISKAFSFSEEAHSNNKRLSGEPYFIHASETAKILAEYGMGASTISSGLLHDVIEDTPVTSEELGKEFGEEILFLVEGVTKLGKLKYHGTDRHNESMRKLFVAMSQDIRILMIKLADRLHNIRTLSYVPKEKQTRIAGETLEIFAPIAYRLGIRKLSRELEDLSFPFVYPKEYDDLKKIVKRQHEDSVENLEKFLKSIKKALAKNSAPYIRTEYRVKGIYSLYKKLKAKKKNIEEVHDMLALRVIVPTIADCYTALGVMHGVWRPLPGKIKDYIAFPKPNGYQALHTTIFTGDGSVVEIQIKTEEMYQHSEYGIASHISYKGVGKKNKRLESLDWIKQLMPNTKSKDSSTKDQARDVPHWIKDLASHHMAISQEGMLNEEIKKDFFNHRIFVFSPIGDVVDLPIESTPVDFAYAIHSDIGNHIAGAKVNNKMVSLDTILKNGDIVEVINRVGSKPNIKWLEYVKTSIAKRSIRSAIQKLKKEDTK